MQNRYELEHALPSHRRCLTAARAVRIHGHAQKAELEREFQERLNELGGRPGADQPGLAGALNAADLPMEELGEWELDASYWMTPAAPS